MAKSAAEIYKEMQAKLKSGDGPVNPPEAAQAAPAESFERKAEEPVQTTVAPTTPEAKAAAGSKPARVKTANGGTSWKETALALEEYVQAHAPWGALDGPKLTVGSLGQITLKSYDDDVLRAELSRRGLDVTSSASGTDIDAVPTDRLLAVILKRVQSS